MMLRWPYSGSCGNDEIQNFGTRERHMPGCNVITYHTLSTLCAKSGPSLESKNNHNKNNNNKTTRPWELLSCLRTIFIWFGGQANTRETHTHLQCECLELHNTSPHHHHQVRCM